MVAIPLDKINYNKVSKYDNVLIFKEFYPKTKNVSYYLKVACTSGSKYFFSPPAHLCAVTYMTEISLIVTLNNQFTLPYLTLSRVLL